MQKHIIKGRMKNQTILMKKKKKEERIKTIDSFFNIAEMFFKNDLTQEQINEFLSKMYCEALRILSH